MSRHTTLSTLCLRQRRPNLNHNPCHACCPRSHGNQPRILPAVVRYLSDAGYKFDSDETNPGVIHVSIGV